MGYAKDGAGNIWEVDASGNPIRLHKQAQTPLSGQAVAPDPKRVKREDNQDYRDAGRFGLSVEDNARQDRKFIFDKTRDLRSDFDAAPEVKAYRNSLPAYVSALKTANTPQGDLALIYAYAKLMDPASAVRDSEAASVANADTIAGQIVAKYRKQIEGTGTFSPEARSNLRAEMRTRINEYKSAHDYFRERFASDAQSFGVDPVRVVGPDISTRYQPDIEKYWKAQDAAKPIVAANQQTNADAAALPADMQKAHAAFLSGWDGNPDSYVAFRKALDKQYSYESAPDDELRNWATMAGQAKSKGIAVPVGIPSPSNLPGNYRSSALGQGMSGVNEGIANTMGFPVDAATAAINLVPRGLNAAANTNLPTIENPFLGSDWLKQNMQGWGIYGQSQDPNAQSARRVGQSVGAAAVPVAGVGSTTAAVKSLLAGLGGGVGAASANRVFPGSPIADFAGDLVGSLGTGGAIVAGSRRAAQNQIESAIPTVDQLKEQAGQLYRQAEARGITADPTMTQNLSDNIRQVLQQDGRISPTGRISDVYPKAKEAVQLVDDYAGNTMNPTQLQTVRGVMADGLSSVDPNERRIARNLTETFDGWANPQAPELAQARDISSRYLTAQQLERARNLAEARTSQFTQSGMENALRSEYRNLDRQAITGKSRFTNDVTDAIEAVARGNWASNLARGLGRFAPTGPVSSMGGVGAGAGIGYAVGGTAGAGVGSAILPVIGVAGRSVAEKLTNRAANVAELTARNGGAIPQAAYFDSDTMKAAAALAASQQINALANLKKVKDKQR